ncbi:MAG TPA: lipoyl(octanoyl) transferase LipB [Saprospiraceae bacterium]|nr:lipoyl(octanoyl) transferase LipB [Saprospiraceae bacterium]
MINLTEIQDWKRISFKDAWDKQSVLAEELKSWKRGAKDLSDMPAHKIIYCEHLPVYTLGKSGSMDNLLLSNQGLSDEGIEFYKINRGGDITYHGPGQIVCYPILDLERIFTDVHKYIRTLEEVVIRTLTHYNINGARIKDYTGVWLEKSAVLPERKICAIGVHMSRWVTLHGFAFNINTDLSYFNKIIPCGISDSTKAVTSLELELCHKVDTEEVKSYLNYYLSELFGLKYAVVPDLN